ncbi:MAG: AMP-binding protein, partial [Oligoflexia bacterium]|nr:AMP-binding protein [Oligoflexia bacterium]
MWTRLQGALLRRPDTVAVRCQPQAWTARRLLDRAMEWAGGLADLDRVGIALPPGPERIAVMLGAAAAGVCWVPLDLSLPEDRRRFIAQDAGLTHVVGEAAGLSRVLPGTRGTLDSTGLADACILYTSGSTGRPKGARISASGLLNLLDTWAQRPGFEPGGVALAIASPTFDMALLEIFLPLLHGGATVPLSREIAADGPALVRAWIRCSASFIVATPTTLRLLCKAGWRPDGATVVSGGEALDSGLAQDLLGLGARLWNGYGVTEATACTCLHRVVDPADAGCIGTATQRQRVHLGPPDGPDEDQGEIWIGGIGVSPGYIGHAATQNPQRFTEFDGLRWYRTGDLARRDPAGRLFHLGRVDRQIKVSGVRIEPGEVEAALRQAAFVRDACVDLRHGRLTAWVVLDDPPTDWVSVLHPALAARLPAAMIPRSWVQVDRFPRTSSDKIDRQALPDPDTGRQGLGPCVGPGDPRQRALVIAWKAALQRGLGIDDPFELVGGDSLIAAEIIARLEGAGWAGLRLSQLRPGATIRQLASALLPASPAPKAACGAGAAWRRMALVQALSPDSYRFHTTAGWRVIGPSAQALQAAATLVVARHRSLRQILAEGSLVDLPCPEIPIVDHLPDDFLRAPLPLDRTPPWRACVVRDDPPRLEMVFHHAVADAISADLLQDELAAALADEALPPPGDPAAFDAVEAAVDHTAALDRACSRLRGLPDPLPLPGAGPAGRAGSAAWTVPLALDLVPHIQGHTLFRVLATAFARWIAVDSGQFDVGMATLLANRSRPQALGVVGFLANPVVLRFDIQPDLGLAAQLQHDAAGIDQALDDGALPFDLLVAALGPQRRADFQPLVQCSFVLQPPPRTVTRGAVSLVPCAAEEPGAPYDLSLELWLAEGGLRGRLKGRQARFEEPALQDLARRLLAVMQAELRDPSLPLCALDDPGLVQRERALLEGGPSQGGCADAVVLPLPIDGRVRRQAFVVGGSEPSDALKLAALPLRPDGGLDTQALRQLAGVRPPRRFSGGPPSVLAGPPMPPGALPDLGALLARAQDAALLTDPGGSTTLGQLRSRALRVAGSLLDWPPQSPVLLVVDDTERYLVALWGCILAGLVPVPSAAPPVADPQHLLVARLLQIGALAAVPCAIVDPALRDLVTARLRVPCFDVDALEAGAPGSRPLSPDGLALMLPTSGSTGTPKLVQHTHGGLCKHLHAFVQAGGFHAGDVLVNWLGLDHVGPLVMVHLTAVAAGACQVHGRTEDFLRDPATALDLLDRHRGSSTLAPNFAWERIAELADQAPPGRWDLRACRLLMNGGEAVLRHTMDHLRQAGARHGMPANAPTAAWGMSETSSGTLLGRPWDGGKDATDANPVLCSGVPIPGIDVRLVDEQGQAVPTGDEGRLQIRGPSVMRSYLGRSAEECFTTDGYFDTGDRAVFEAQGVRITGRDRELLKVRGGNLSPQEIERIALEVGGLEDVAAVGYRPEGQASDALAILYRPGPQADGGEPGRIRAEIARRTGIVPAQVRAVGADQMVRAGVGKLPRGRLRAWLEADSAGQGRLLQRCFVPCVLRPLGCRARTADLPEDPVQAAVLALELLQQDDSPLVLGARGAAFEVVAGLVRCAVAEGRLARVVDPGPRD